MSPSNPDPYTSKAAADASPNEKIKELKSIIKGAKFSMLTTQSASGTMHSRAMTPSSDAGLVFKYIGNLDSGKFDDLEAHPEVNISFSDASTTNWASAAGKAKVVQDAATLKDLWSPDIKAWFGDLGDGKHTGNWDDPRVAVIEVVPSEIRYWIRTESSIGQAYEVLKGAVTGETASPGNLRVISPAELALARELDAKN